MADSIDDIANKYPAHTRDMFRDFAEARKELLEFLINKVGIEPEEISSDDQSLYSAYDIPDSLAEEYEDKE